MQKDKIGKYKIVSRAGAGAFGIVWKATSSEDGKSYAIKEISKGKMTKQLIENLIREVQISLKLEHANLIKCYATMESKNNYYIVFEYCEGGDLGKYLLETKKINLPESIFMLKQLRDAYKYLFNENILHRDIKLDNILIVERAKMGIKLSDFGCSKIDPFGTTVCGTPKYMALEVLENCGQYNYKADLWSIGLCFWELVYGSNSFPFSLKSADALKSDIKKFSGDNLRFPPTPKLPQVFYDFFRSILQLSTQLRMEAKDFFEHPIFSWDGTEQELVGKMQKLSVTPDRRRSSVIRKDASPAPKVGPTSSKKPSSEGLNDKPKDAPGNVLSFANIKKYYNEKILEVKLIKAVVKELTEFIKPDWNKKYASHYKCLCLIVLSKGLIKSENSYSTLAERRNSYKLPNFDQFVQYPNESLPLKDELKQLTEELKKMDDLIYGELINDCYDPKYLEDINTHIYKNSTADAKKPFLADTYQFVKKNSAGMIDEFDKASFEIQLKRSFIILKGEVLQKIDEFH